MKMSHPLESDQCSGPRSNKETENHLIPEDENNEEFNFKVDEALIFAHKDNQPKWGFGLGINVRVHQCVHILRIHSYINHIVT